MFTLSHLILEEVNICIHSDKSIGVWLCLLLWDVTHEGWTKIWQLEVRKQLEGCMDQMTCMLSAIWQWSMRQIDQSTKYIEDKYSMLDICEFDEASLIKMMNGGFLWLLRQILDVEHWHWWSSFLITYM